MLGCADDDLLACPIAKPNESVQSEIQRFCCATGEDDFRWTSVDHFGDGFPGLLYRSGGIPSPTMIAAGRVPVAFREPGQHRRTHARIKWCGGVIVEVD